MQEVVAINFNFRVVFSLLQKSAFFYSTNIVIISFVKNKYIHILYFLTQTSVNKYYTLIIYLLTYFLLFFLSFLFFVIFFMSFNFICLFITFFSDFFGSFTSCLACCSCFVHVPTKAFFGYPTNISEPFYLVSAILFFSS